MKTGTSEGGREWRGSGRSHIWSLCVIQSNTESESSVPKCISRNSTGGYTELRFCERNGALLIEPAVGYFDLLENLT